ncbi:MAG TPA: TPM domain-containing protein [Gemmataceae bacterium]|jgi:hypothetical protein
MTPTLPRLLLVLGLACLASAARAEEPPAAIRDDAGLFHADAIARAEKEIDDIRHAFDRNVFVRTVESVAPHEHKRFWFLRTPQVNRILDAQARQIADEVGAEGIYVVICRKPRDVHVIVRPGDDPLFNRHDAETLRSAAALRLSKGDSDAALLALVDQVRATLQSNVARGPSMLVLNEFALIAILGGGVALWLVLRIVRFKMRIAHAPEEVTAERTRETPALLGAMFGFPAGLWIYDKLYPCPSGAPAPLCEPEPPAPPEGESAEHAEDHSADERTEDAPVS